MDGTVLKEDFRELGTTVKTVVERLRTVSSGVSRVVREMGTEGKLGGQANVESLSGTWKDLIDDKELEERALQLDSRNKEIAQAIASLEAKSQESQYQSQFLTNRSHEIRTSIRFSRTCSPTHSSSPSAGERSCISSGRPRSSRSSAHRCSVLRS